MNGFGRGGDGGNKSKAGLVTRESVGMTLLLFSAVLFIITATSKHLLGDIGLAIASFFVGLFGFFVYPLLILVCYLSFVMVFGKKLLPASWLFRGVLLLIAVFLIVHTATAERFYGVGEFVGYGGYLRGCWISAREGVSGGTGGGVVFGVIVYPIRALLSAAGAYVVFSLLTALALYFVLLLTPLKKRIAFLARVERAGAPKKERQEAKEGNPTKPYPYSFDDLSAPERAPMPAREEPTPYAYAPEVQSAAPSRSEHDVRRDDGRRVLFGGDASPANAYRRNLIYDRDSSFNTQPRGSSVLAGDSYSEQYTSRAEEARPSMPRRVTEEKTTPLGGYTALQDDFNYPETPSYRAPASAPVVNDYYAHDVPFTPNDEPLPPEEPAMPVQTEAPEMSPQVEERTPERSVEPPKENELREAKEREANFRSMFTRTSETPARVDFKDVPQKDDDFVRGAGSRNTLTFGFGRTAEPEETFTRERRVEPEETFTRERRVEPEETFTRERRVEPEETFTRERRVEPEETFTRDRRIEPEETFTNDRASEPGDLFSWARKDEPEEAPVEESRVFRSPVNKPQADLFESDDFEDDFADNEDHRVQEEKPQGRFTVQSRVSERGARSAAPAMPEAPAAPEPKKKHVYKKYVPPRLDNLRFYNDTVYVAQEEIERNSAIIVETLRAFRVEADVIKVVSGSSVTRYDINIPANVPVGAVLKREEEIAMRLCATDGIKIYSNSGAGAISIEVPNKTRATVGLRSVLTAPEYINPKPGSLMFALGKDVEGKNVCGNITKMKHLLVAGATGSGKSVCLNAMLISLICKYSPEDLRLILIDPKKVEFAVFDGLPHLMINEIIGDAQKAVVALNWAIKEMERRYALFEQKTRSERVTVREIDEYNAKLNEDEEKLPKIIVVVDELADLMAVAKKDIEERIARLTAKSRAAGIHLVIATQRPSVNVITGTIKANLPTRIAFRVIQEVDSRVILDYTGAEKLLGNGDMLYFTEGLRTFSRVQGAFLSSEEVQKVIDDIKEHNEAYFDDSVADYINKTGSSESGGDSFGDDDDGGVEPEYIRALGIVVKLGSASISLIQRKCSVGYNHAGKIIEWMEAKGYISEFDGKAKARTVILTKEEYESLYGSLD